MDRHENYSYFVYYTAVTQSCARPFAHNKPCGYVCHVELWSKRTAVVGKVNWITCYHITNGRVKTRESNTSICAKPLHIRTCSCSSISAWIAASDPPPSTPFSLPPAVCWWLSLRPLRNSYPSGESGACCGGGGSTRSRSTPTPAPFATFPFGGLEAGCSSQNTKKEPTSKKPPSYARAPRQCGGGVGDGERDGFLTAVVAAAGCIRSVGAPPAGSKGGAGACFCGSSDEALVLERTGSGYSVSSVGSIAMAVVRGAERQKACGGALLREHQKSPNFEGVCKTYGRMLTNGELSPLELLVGFRSQQQFRHREESSAMAAPTPHGSVQEDAGGCHLISENYAYALQLILGFAALAGLVVRVFVLNVFPCTSTTVRVRVLGCVFGLLLSSAELHRAVPSSVSKSNNWH